MYTHTFTKGYSLVEVMIAISVLMLAIVAPMTIAYKSIQSSRYALEQNTAIFLAQEGVSIAESLRTSRFLTRLVDDSQWTFWAPNNHFAPCTTEFGCGFDASNPYTLLTDGSEIVTCTETGENCRLYLDNESGLRSAYHLNGAEENETQFIRRMYWEYRDLDNNPASYDEVVVTVVVEWESQFLGHKQTVSVSSALYNMYRSLN